MLLHSSSITNIRAFLLIFMVLQLPASTEERAFATQSMKLIILRYSFMIKLYAFLELDQIAGRSVFIHKELSKKGGQEVLRVNSMIGSRPPQCKRRCLACSDCEAVQVPATSGVRSASVPLFMIGSEKDDSSNYKLLCWKCKCGNFIFNP
ncbi:EPIDERMAL PATTERNING FACTOR-like protein 2 isoform X1 [Phalaenopsis equestris]|uniref:EPIDERMAL PATTERNING FACTOR-like protein 2 isoform X1 n=1 Tax=Phalaenopsis equestris TaxID=78828 RepID=UPI0009E646CD|nr:EPIDERMAL PATTERNING FACTOR-like protein 2 isoform X1 [Phalaenopsis equestris]